MNGDSLYGKAIYHFREIIKALEASGAQYRNDPLLEMTRGLVFLAQGLQQQEQALQQRLDEIAKVLQPRK